MRLLRIALFLEIGFVLLIVPWSAYWDRNYFASSVLLIRSLTTNDFVRGAVSGLGLLNIVAGLLEFAAPALGRRQRHGWPSSSDHITHQRPS